MAKRKLELFVYRVDIMHRDAEGRWDGTWYGHYEYRINKGDYVVTRGCGFDTLDQARIAGQEKLAQLESR